MKKIIFTLCILVLAVGGCTKYDDSALWNEVNSQAKRIAALEVWQTTVNSNIAALQELVNALKSNRYITNVSPFATPAPGGYDIIFSSGTPANIRILNGTNGAKGDKGDKGDTGDDGEKGAKGDDGDDGEKGAKGDKGDTGAAGETPPIGVKLNTDNVYYWTLDGEFIEVGGQKLPVTGPKGDKGDDGGDGQPGNDGNDGKTPKVAIGSDGKWYLCPIGDCTGSSGDDLANTTGWDDTGIQATGGDGVDGTNGDAIFAANGIDNSHDDYVEFTLADGITKIQVPKYKDIGITFTQPKVFTAGVAQTVPYTLTGGVQFVKVIDVPQEWTVMVTKTSGAGTFTITPPAAFTDENRHGAAIILIVDGTGRTVTHALRLSGITPPYAASTQVWILNLNNGNTVVWSDEIQMPDCNKPDFEYTDQSPQCRSYYYEGEYYYYYNKKYFIAHGLEMCPNPWNIAWNALAEFGPAAKEVVKRDWRLSGEITATDGAPQLLGSTGTMWLSNMYWDLDLSWSNADVSINEGGDLKKGRSIRCVLGI